jgi:DNA-binding transcriptional regulator YiaG
MNRKGGDALVIVPEKVQELLVPAENRVRRRFQQEAVKTEAQRGEIGKPASPLRRACVSPEEKLAMTPENFKAWRQRMEWTQQQCAQALEVSTRAVQMWETGDRPISRILELATRYLEQQAQPS